MAILPFSVLEVYDPWLELGHQERFMIREPLLSLCSALDINVSDSIMGLFAGALVLLSPTSAPLFQPIQVRIHMFSSSCISPSMVCMTKRCQHALHHQQP